MIREGGNYWLDFAQYGISGTTYVYLLSAATGCTYSEADLHLVGGAHLEPDAPLQLPRRLPAGR